MRAICSSSGTRSGAERVRRGGQEDKRRSVFVGGDRSSARVGPRCPYQHTGYRPLERGYRIPGPWPRRLEIAAGSLLRRGKPGGADFQSAIGPRAKIFFARYARVNRSKFSSLAALACVALDQIWRMCIEETAGAPRKAASRDIHFGTIFKIGGKYPNLAIIGLNSPKYLRFLIHAQDTTHPRPVGYRIPASNSR